MFELPKRKYVEAHEVANYLSISRSQVYTYYEHGLLSGIKPSHKVLRILRSSVLELEKRVFCDKNA